MPRLFDRLVSTEHACQLAKASGPRTEYRVAGVRGLVLRVNDSGTKSWSCNYKSPITSSWRKVSLGSYPTVSLHRAKEMALDCLAGARVGRDPLALDSSSDLTFKGIAEEYLGAHKGRHSLEWQREVRQVLDRDLLPAINGHRASAVKRADIARIVERIAQRGAPASANSALKITRVIYRWGIATGRCETDPTLGLRKFPSQARERVLTDDEIRLAWNAHTAFQKPYRLQLLTAVRIGEVLRSTKSEFDLEQRIWTIPANRTKSRRVHQLPLSPQAVEVVRAAMVASPGGPWLFPSARSDGPLECRSAATVLARLNTAAGIQERFKPHDLRRTAATRLGDLGTPDEVVERILNHAASGVTRRHYNHSAKLEEMRKAMQAWGVYLARLVREQSVTMHAD